MNTKPILIGLVVVALLVIGYLVFAQSTPESPTETATTTDSAAPIVRESVSSTDTAPSTSGVTITYNGASFSPATVTVAKGTPVTWVSTSGDLMWLGSNDHPTHTRYGGTSTSEHCVNGAATNAGVFDQCGIGGRYSFTFSKPGTWEYHNHANSRAGGTVIVTP